MSHASIVRFCNMRMGDFFVNLRIKPCNPIPNPFALKSTHSNETGRASLDVPNLSMLYMLNSRNIIQIYLETNVCGLHVRCFRVAMALSPRTSSRKTLLWRTCSARGQLTKMVRRQFDCASIHGCDPGSGHSAVPILLGSAGHRKARVVATGAMLRCLCQSRER